MTFKTFITTLVIFFQKKFGRNHIIYRFGANIYLIILNLLRMIGIPSRYFEDDSFLIKKILHQSLDFKPKVEGKHIVFLSIRGWPVHLLFESLMAARLRMEGHRITFLSCADNMPSCMYGTINHPQELQRDCGVCIHCKKILWEGTFDVKYLSCPQTIIDSIQNQVNQLDLTSCQSFIYDRAPYGKLVYRGIVWFLRRSRLLNTDLDTYRKMLISAHIVRHSLEDYLSKNNVDTVVMLNGDFPSERVASWVLQQKSIRFITHDYTFHERLAIAVNKSVWDDLSFENKHSLRQTDIDEADRKEAEKILRLWRKHGGYQGHLFWSQNNLRTSENLQAKFNAKKNHLVVAYTNMTFESSVTCKNRIFRDQFHWIEKLITFFNAHPEIQLVIRIHPAEVRQSHWKPNESLYFFLEDEIKTIPPNVQVIAPDEKISSYALGMMADAILVYSSTLGLELAERNKFVITAAHVHYANRGFTIDPISENEYFESILNATNGKYLLKRNHRQLLVEYVAWLFFHRLTPFEATSGIQEGWPKVNVGNIEDLLSLRYPGIQRIAKLISSKEQWW